MPPCTVCTHPKRLHIDRALVTDGATVRDTARKFDVTVSALGRHRKNHLAPALAKHEEHFDLATAQGIGNQLATIHAEATRLLHEAREDGNRRDQLSALARLERQIELAAKLASLIQDGQRVAVSVQLDTGWPLVRSAILETLANHPAALQAVSERLAALEQPT